MTPIDTHKLTEMANLEMCRNAKIRCNHETPVCRRFTRRGLICEYNPAPLTKPRDNGLEQLGNLSTVPLNAYLTPNSDRPVQTLPTQSPITPLGDGTTKTSLFHNAGRSFGAMHFSAFFSENESSFRPVIQDVAEGEG